LGRARQFLAAPRHLYGVSRGSSASSNNSFTSAKTRHARPPGACAHSAILTRVRPRFRELPETVRLAGMQAPALIINRRGRGTRERLKWSNARPLHGQRVLGTAPKLRPTTCPAHRPLWLWARARTSSPSKAVNPTTGPRRNRGELCDSRFINVVFTAATASASSSSDDASGVRFASVWVGPCELAAIGPKTAEVRCARYHLDPRCPCPSDFNRKIRSPRRLGRTHPARRAWCCSPAADPGRVSFAAIVAASERWSSKSPLYSQNRRPHRRARAAQQLQGRGEVDSCTLTSTNSPAHLRVVRRHNAGTDFASGNWGLVTSAP